MNTETKIPPFLDRLTRLVGEQAVSKLMTARVFIFGLGGVGSWCAEALARSGLGSLVLVDDDFITETNINRQSIALQNTLGESKIKALTDRIRLINPACRVTAIQQTYSASTITDFDIKPTDFVVDAIDSVDSKITLAEHCERVGATLFASMGTALKLDPTRLKVADIWKTEVCPLARLVRQGLRKRGFTGHFKVVYSTELIERTSCSERTHDSLRPSKIINGSAVQVTATAGMILCSLVVEAIMHL